MHGRPIFFVLPGTIILIYDLWFMLNSHPHSVAVPLKVKRTCITPFVKLQPKALRYGSHRVAPANYTIPASTFTLPLIDSMQVRSNFLKISLFYFGFQFFKYSQNFFHTEAAKVCQWKYIKKRLKKWNSFRNLYSVFFFLQFFQLSF